MEDIDIDIYAIQMGKRLDMDFDVSCKHKEDEQLHHVLLPRVLPQEKGDLYQVEHDLMTLFVRNVEDIAESLPSKTVELFQSLQNVHTERTPINVSNRIKALGPGDTFAMFVRFQHSMIVIHVPSDENPANIENAIVATIPGSLHPNEVYDGKKSDLEFSYPQQAIKVKFSEMLRSEDFANQLCVLFEGLPIERQNRDCVSKWLVSILMDTTSVAASRFPTITKKIRDEMFGASDTNYFRRSSFYMSIKVLLQHSCTMHDVQYGELLYKIAMLKFVDATCSPYKAYDNFDVDLLSQMIAKLARRIEKVILPEKVPNNVAKLYETVVVGTKETIRVIRGKIDEQIQKIHQTVENDAELPLLTELDFNLDICQKMSELKAYINVREKQSQTTGIERKPISTYNRHFQNDFPNETKIKALQGDMETRIFWLDFENMVLYKMQIDSDRLSANELRTWTFEYSKYAEKHYEDNPLFVSRMLLVRLKLIAILDKKATEKHQLLKQHHSGINPKIIDSLLIPQHIDMNIAFELENYFNDRNSDAEDPSLVGETTVTNNSFSVKYAKTDPEMKNIRDQILQEDRENEQEKRNEWKNVRKRVEDWKNKAKGMSCYYYYTRNGIEKHSFYCDKCELLAKVNGTKVMQYEHLLPDGENEQFAIVFEINTPNEIACLRDTLYGFTKFCHGSAETLEIQVDWTHLLKDVIISNGISTSVKLGSTTSQKTISYPADCSFERFVVQCTHTCIFHAGKQSLVGSLSDDCVKDRCTFKTSGAYTNMQWTLHSTKHTENQVLSAQSDCRQDLTLSEYKNFGMLRADGYRLQLRKLYAMIRSEGLAFEKESVLALIMQTLWECEVSGESGFVRESHIDFRDEKFCSAMVDLLKSFIELQRDNWRHPYKLLMATFIAARAMEINEDDRLAIEIGKLLHEIRMIGLGWISKIEETVSKMPSADEKIERESRLKLIYVAITGGLTYYVHPNHNNYCKIFQNEPAALRAWLQFVITLNSNIRMYTNDEKQLPKNLRMFLRLIESIGVLMEPRVKSLAQHNENELFAVIRKQWPRAESSSFKSRQFHPDYSQILQVTVMMVPEQFVTIDIISGSFLVNGFPLTSLPRAIMESNIYRWFFGNVVFEVQPNDQSSFSTRLKYNKCGYEFRKTNSLIVITERSSNQSDEPIVKELIDHRKFVNDFPSYLVQNYSHWWNKSTNSVEFRRRALDIGHFSAETTVDYSLDLEKRHLIQTSTASKMLDIHSDSFQKIAKQLSRLEYSKYIHVLIKEEQNDEKVKIMANVELVRMNLKFMVDRQSALVSNEFNGMCVSRRQNVGTLYGLKCGLVLETMSEIDDKKILLIQNGPLRKESKGGHAFVSSDSDNEHVLYNPPFYQYKVDKFCRQLKATNGTDEAWFYLAYLHAITSHGEVEPFTGMSGTERALQILQSSYVWSSSPYDSEAIRILMAIADLTPLRKLIDGKQIVTWPVGIPKHSAQDCFVFIVTKLLEDSQRLAELYTERSKQTALLKTDLNLNERDHWRCQQLKPNFLQKFMNVPILTTTLPTLIQRIKIAMNTRYVCNLYHRQQFHVSVNLNLKKFLTGGVNLAGIKNKKRVPNLLMHNVRQEFRDMWIALYDAARNQTLTPTQFALILSFFAHHGENIKAIFALQAVAMNPSEFQRIDPPQVNKFQIANYSKKQVRDLLDSHCIVPDQYYSEMWRDSGLRQRHDLARSSTIDGITEDITRSWKNVPFQKFDFTKKWKVTFPYIDYATANKMMDEQLTVWHENHQLNEFIDSVEERLKLLPSSPLEGGRFIPRKIPMAKNKVKYRIDFDAKMHSNFDHFQNEIENARDVWEIRTRAVSRSAQDWFTMLEQILNNDKTCHLIRAGIFPRLVPSLLLPKIADAETNDRLKCLIGAWAVTIAREQHQSRVQAYVQRPEFEVALNGETSNEPHLNWTPHAKPEWLLFEIEQNLTIRQTQVKVAERMIDPPEIRTKHSVMQLNMGEGKTAVIVPILAARLADGTQACQITVLKSLFATNYKSLRQYLGGFLNRQIYTFPCHRHLRIEKNIEQIFNIYQECERNKGVILTLPEYRLSAQLKIYESIANKNEATQKLLKVYKWTNEHIRNILDESDAILHPKYQLIYTIGGKFSPDGGAQRWLVTQAVLKRVPHHMIALYRRYGLTKIELHDGYMENRPDVFIPCRILDDSCEIFDALKCELIDDFLDGRLAIDFTGITATRKENLKTFLSQNMNQNADQNAFQIVNEFPPEQRDKILILSGLLRCEVLKMALTKRWRVNYGVNESSECKMAIPFKAKDVAAEMTEFGHTDVAICLTQLSYYYKGLTDAQLYQVFDVLDHMQDSTAIYGKWIQSLPSASIDQTIASYNGVNLEDPNQRDCLLFPLLRFNMNVIDFWLSNMVYPQKLKIFEKKLMCTAWDLCGYQFTHKVTGFSGTNDTKNLLPAPIAQNDLAELENTNEEMRQTLLQPRNHPYKRLPANVSGKQILRDLVASEIPVLLDSGALMLELNNKEVAFEWLQLTSQYDAAVYFDERDSLQTIDRQGGVTQFEYSVYRDNLAKCVVYLDDAHTRGTDLKFPLDWKACVTLSGDITRDKTVQSCMRMRQLSTSQSVLFWASHEADVRLRKVCNLSADAEVENQHVLEFIEHNSREFEKANMIHWTTASINYTKKMIGHKLYESATDAESMQKLYDKCVDNDLIKLREMYGEKKEVTIKVVAWNKFSILTRDCEPQIRDYVRQMQDYVDGKLADDMTKFTHAIDEEQEKELEQEVELETQVERPRGAMPATPEFDERLQQLISNGWTDDDLNSLKSDNKLLSIPKSLSRTQLYQLCKNNEHAWAEHILVTNDFQNVIDNSTSKCDEDDEFLRPVRWLAHIQNPSGNYILVLLSTFECNHLLPAFKRSKNSTLFMYQVRLSQRHNSLIHDTNLQVSGATNHIIKMCDEVQIGVYAGLMYFSNECEQDEYCGFLGLIPKPRDGELKEAFEDNIINSDGFVPMKNRRKSKAISECVSQCKFIDNPVNLTIKLIKAHHQFLPKDSHTASILNGDTKVHFQSQDDAMEIE